MRVAFNKDNVGRFDRHVRARTNSNSNTNIGLRECGRRATPYTFRGFTQGLVVLSFALKDAISSR